MENTLKNLDILDPRLRENVSIFCQRLLQDFAGRICFICIYGSASVGDHIPKRSDINLMVMIDRLEMEDLQKSLKLIKFGRKKRISAPLFLTPEHINTSLDVFPAEFLDMKEKHISLYGTDPFPDLVIDPKNLRLQCEQQIKGKIIRLRQAYLETGLNKRHILRVLTGSLTSLLPILRNSIRLVKPGSIPPKTNEEIIRQVCHEFHLEGKAFIDILDIKKGAHKPDRPCIDSIFKGYMNDLTELATKIDRINIIHS
ncbi:hypothetical protein JXL19_09830 [bacterium]|nr:hypothetical protein [bacterium]